MSHLYLVVSEELLSCPYSESLEPPESYRIAEIVNAKTPSQAKYLAWKFNKHESDIREIPKFKCQLKIKDSGLETPRVITKIIEKLSTELDFDGIYGWLWSFKEDLLILDDKWKILLNKASSKF